VLGRGQKREPTISVLACATQSVKQRLGLGDEITKPTRARLANAVVLALCCWLCTRPAANSEYTNKHTNINNNSDNNTPGWVGQTPIRVGSRLRTTHQLKQQEDLDLELVFAFDTRSLFVYTNKQGVCTLKRDQTLDLDLVFAFY
jgi:hypothetical protein